MADQEIQKTLIESGWPASEVDEIFGKKPNFYALVSNLKRFKTIYITGGIILILASAGVFAYVNGIFPFAREPVSSDEIFKLLLKAKEINTTSYLLNLELKVTPRDSGAKSILESIPSMKAKQELLDRDKQRFDDFKTINSKLRTYLDPDYVYNQTTKKYVMGTKKPLPKTLDEIGLPSKDPLGNSYVYIPLSDNYNLKITFETQEAIDKINSSYVSSYYSKPEINGKTVTFTSKTYNYYYFTAQQDLPVFLGFLNLPAEEFNRISGDLDIKLHASGDTGRNAEKIDTRFQIGGSANFEDLNVEADVEFLKKGDMFFVRINKFPGLFFDVTRVKNRWIKFEKSDLESSNYYNPFRYETQALAETSSKSQIFVRQIERFFEIVNEENILLAEGPEKTDINGQTAYKYSLYFNKEKIPVFYRKLTDALKNEFRNDAIIEFDQKTMDFLNSKEYGEIFDYLADNSSLEVWADRQGFPIKVLNSFRYIPENKAKTLSEKQFIITSSLELSNINEGINISAPKDFIDIIEVSCILKDMTEQECAKERSKIQTEKTRY